MFPYKLITNKRELSTRVVSFAKQLQEAEKVTGELIILHDLLTWPKRRNKHTHAHRQAHISTITDRCMHKYFNNTSMSKHKSTHTFIYTDTHRNQRKDNRSRQHVRNNRTDRKMESEDMLKERC